MRKLKEDLSHTLHNFVDTVVQDVVAKVASNYRDTLTKHKSTSSQLLEPKIEPKAPSGDESVLSVKHQPSVPECRAMVPTPTPTIHGPPPNRGKMITKNIILVLLLFGANRISSATMTNLGADFTKDGHVIFRYRLG